MEIESIFSQPVAKFCVACVHLSCWLFCTVALEETSDSKELYSGTHSVRRLKQLCLEV